MPVMIVGGCAGPLSTLDTAGPAAADVATFWWIMLSGAAGLTIFVLTLLMLAFLPHNQPIKNGGRLWICWLGLAMPAAVLTALVGYALMLGQASIAHRAPGLVVVQATGHQWYWTFRQPGSIGAIATHGVLHIPAGRPIDVQIGSADVIHSFWVPRLGGKMDAIPGQINTLRIQADRPGIFEGQCAEFCGLNHAANRFRVVVHGAASWERFQRNGGQ